MPALPQNTVYKGCHSFPKDHVNNNLIKILIVQNNSSMTCYLKYLFSADALINRYSKSKQMLQPNIAVEQTSSYPNQQLTLKEIKQIEEDLERKFALIQEQQDYYHLAHYECDRI